jgi:DNA-binding ferritin-like protein
MKLKLLNAILRLHESNIRNLHWNSVGAEFNDAHKAITEEYYELFATNIDKVSEIMGMLGINPPNYMETADMIRTTENKYIVVKSDRMYNREEIIKALDIIFDNITSLLVEVLEDPDIQSPGNAGIKAELENILYTFDFQKRYINKRRSM